MRIGIEDRGLISLMMELTRLGHSVVAYIDGIPQHMLWDIPGVTYVDSAIKLFDHKLDFCISSDFQDKNIRGYAHMFDVPCIGHSDMVLELEANRDFAYRVIQQDARLRGLIKLPAAQEFTDKEAAIKWLTKQKKDWVAKQHRNSPLDTTDNRTVISRAQDKHALALQLLSQDKNPWFEGNGGGIRFEQFIQGQEVCFGSFWTGTRFLRPIYWCQEHKSPQNGGRTGLLTGEVGTTVGVSDGKNKRVAAIFDQLGEILYDVEGNASAGMIDFNTIIDSKGDMWFIEFTCRWGRPTMELQLAMLDKNWPEVIRQALRPSSLEPKLPYKYKRGLGVTVFDYGLPYIVDPNKKPFLYTPPKFDRVDGSVVMPFLTNPVAGGGQWMAMPDDPRHFVSIGLQAGPSKQKDFVSQGQEWAFAQKRAYRPLANFSAPGMTWRDDIGDTAAQVEELIKCNDLL